VVPPLTLARLLAWADLSPAWEEPLWPAYRLVDMHGPRGSVAEPRLTAFATVWRATVNQLVDRLLQHFARHGTTVPGIARMGASH
jgi:hypothetical protein